MSAELLMHLMALKTTSYVSYDAPEVDLDSVPNSKAEDSDSDGVGDSDADVNIDELARTGFS